MKLYLVTLQHVRNQSGIPILIAYVPANSFRDAEEKLLDVWINKWGNSDFVYCAKIEMIARHYDRIKVNEGVGSFSEIIYLHGEKEKLK